MPQGKDCVRGSTAPRRWFQFHLLTGVVMMVAASGFLGLNAALRGSEIGGWKCEFAGWPVPNWFKTDAPSLPLLPGSFNYEHDSYITAYGIEFLYVNNGWNWKAVALNLGVGLILVSSLSVLCEYILRRRERAAS
ncbi:MAG: hypothetical protein HY291_15720 [Planctomycetes bacterium]|nr:hypothetical protein [Planctomycetota bacterium]